MSGKGETLSDSSDSEQEKKIKAKFRKEHKNAAKRKAEVASGTPPSKKLAVKPTGTAGNSRQSGGQGEEKISIGKMKFVTVREFKNKLYVDIREHYEKDGELLPGRKGVSLPAEQWQNLKSIIDVIDDRLAQMS